MRREEKLSLDETQILADHATAMSSTKQVAIELGLKEPRVSEMKSKARKMTTGEAAILRDIYGTPSQKSGIYLEAEIVKGIDAFIDKVNDGALSRNIKHLLSFINSEGGLLALLRTFRLNEHGSSSVWGINTFDDSPETLQYITDGINLLIDTPAFNKWGRFIDSIKDEKKFSNSLINSVVFDVDNINETSDRCFRNCEPVKMTNSLVYTLQTIGLRFYKNNLEKIDVFRLYVIWQLQTKFKDFIYPVLTEPTGKGFELGRVYKTVDIEPDVRELVVTGKEVWNLWEEKLNNKLYPEMLFKAPAINSWYSETFREEKDLYSESYSSAGMSVIQSYKLNYYFVVTLFEEYQNHSWEIIEDIRSGRMLFEDAFSGKHRTFFIELKNGEEIISAMGKLFDLLDLEEKATHEIKKELASKGGTISGAVYFD